jgi:hypothetical protein
MQHIIIFMEDVGARAIIGTDNLGFYSSNYAGYYFY